tara:strand:- start:73 stop:633 length:561 start_codon:yes stop_codon:yes gene_type:complete
MGYKLTTDPFVLRGKTDLTITGDSAGATTTIDTSLDTLNREVLVIHEVDIQHGTLPKNAMDGITNGATMESLSIANSVCTEDGFFSLDAPEYVAGADMQYVARGGHGGGSAAFVLSMDKNPDSRDQASKDAVPLAIVTASELFLRSGFNSTATLATTDTYQAKFRIICQRAKADADTYAALVTGLL